ncbi:SIR2 family NAD-dependent protein deacylase [Hydrogenophaga atypica]|uniref:protein acetyllysine N-acetyltransferase n=1 Tax=Hydrogenophaga atypica TaxID=249409 RepID=A0ABW2QQJ6_9BURK
MDSHSDLIDHAADLIAQSHALVVACGAGMGVDSGLPDFRGTEGFWRAYPALGREGIEFYRIANPQAFHVNPARAWGFYGHRLNLYRQTKPHEGFSLLSGWAEKTLDGGCVFTSNVDGHFQLAAPDLKPIEECHGSIHHLQCLAGCSPQIWPADEFSPVVDEVNCLLLNEPPRCPKCGALARPNVMMFGDFDWQEERQQNQSKALEQWLSRASRPVVVEIGAGTAIPSVRHFTHRVLHELDGRLVRINPREWTVPTPRDVGIPMGALQTLQAIDRALAERW